MNATFHRIELRNLSWPEDRTPLLALDTSFTTNRLYRIQRESRSFTLEEVMINQPVHKHYALASEIESLVSLDWVKVASNGGQIVAVVAMEVEAWNRRANLHHLYVDRALRQMGIGRFLVETALDEAQKRGARSLWAETQAINHKAIGFYERMGFEWCGLDTSLYDPADVPEDEVALFFSRTVT